VCLDRSLGGTLQWLTDEYCSGEHFRRTLNAQRTSRPGAALPLTLATPQLVGRSLPYAEIYGPQPHHSSSRALGVDVKVTRMTAAGPIPRSWAAAAAATTAPPVQISESEDPATWRATALSLFFVAQSDSEDYDYDYDLASTAAESSPHPHLHPTRTLSLRSRCPSLAECCLRVLLEYCASSDADVTTLEELASFLAPHHRKEAVRMCAVRSPLSGARLRALLGEGRNHVEGELVVVQPASPLRPEMFRTQTQTQTHAHMRVDDRQHRPESESEEPWEWDDAEADHSGSTVTDVGSDWQEQGSEQEQQPFTAVAIVSTTLSIPVLLALPSSLTRLALVHLSAPIPIHRLPDKCPLLELLDISYNPWLAEPAWGEERALERVEWGRWAYLRVLGCRDCGVTSEELGKVNEGRWEDVRIVT
jgi:hypothetical protein